MHEKSTEVVVLKDRSIQRILEARLIELVKEYGADAVLAAAEKLLASETQNEIISDNVLTFKGEADRKREKVINRLLKHAEKLRW